jgi:hypothetical protein
MRIRRLLAAGAGGLALAGGLTLGLAWTAEDLPGALRPLAAPAERVWARVLPPRVAAAARLTGLTEAEQAAVAALAGRLDARIVWSSNRSGDHELYLLDLRTRDLRRLTRDPHVDFFARFSPDGRRLVFLRSQRPWVSFRETGAWDVHVMDADGRNERRVARGGYHPTWAPDGAAVVFLRGSRVVRLDLASGEERVLLDGQAAEAIRGGLETPALAADGRQLALTSRSGRYDGVGVLDLATGALARLSAGQACQLDWAGPLGLVWIEPGGRGGTRVMTAPGPAGPARLLVDLPGRHSHEYFPRVTADGRWLVWGAAAEGHEHDRADYELFAWPVGAPPEAAVRLTHHPGNDQWPDVTLAR